MGITNGYTTLEDYKAYATSRGQTNEADATDDHMIEDLIESASRTIDRMTGRTFYARTATHYYDLPTTSSLWIDDDDLLTITTLTNGDSTVITATAPVQYTLYPLNTTPKFEIRLKWTSNVYWIAPSDGETSGVITVLGTWGYAATPPDEIKTLVNAIVLNLYRRRHGENVAQTSRVTSAGVVVTPEGIPEWGKPIIDKYKRYI